MQKKLVAIATGKKTDLKGLGWVKRSIPGDNYLKEVTFGLMEGDANVQVFVFIIAS